MALVNINPGQRREALILLKDFRELQEERIRQYNQLNNAHKTYLETGKQSLGQTYDFETYKTCVKQSTDQFKSISGKVLELSDKLGTIAQLNGNDNGPPASFLKQIQVIRSYSDFLMKRVLCLRNKGCTTHSFNFFSKHPVRRVKKRNYDLQWICN